MNDPSTAPTSRERPPRAPTRILAALGVALLAAAGVALWASEGAKVFVDNAFAALIACF